MVFVLAIMFILIGWALYKQYNPSVVLEPSDYVYGWNDRRSGIPFSKEKSAEWQTDWLRCDKDCKEIEALRLRNNWRIEPPVEELAPSTFHDSRYTQYYECSSVEDVKRLKRLHDAESCDVTYNNQTNKYDILVKYEPGQ